MARTKVQIERGNGLRQTVVIDPAATKGATLGSNVYLNGAVATPAAVTQWLGLQPGGTSNIRSGFGIVVSGTNPKSVNVNPAEAFPWTGQHQWTKALWGPNGAAATPAFTFTSDPDTGLYRVGANNLGIATGGALRWDVNNSRTFQQIQHYISMVVPDSTITSLLRVDATNTSASDVDIFEISAPVGTGSSATSLRMAMWDAYIGSPARGFRWDLSQSGGNPAELAFTAHHNSDSGTQVYKCVGDRAQLQFVNGAAATPPVAFQGATGTGLFYDSANGRLGVSIGGTYTYSFGNDALRSNNPVWAGAGSASIPGFTFAADPDTGIYDVSANVLGLATGGALRFQVGAAGQWGIGGATYGTSGDLFASGGASAAPSWTSTIAGAKTWSGDARFNANVGFNNTAPIAKPTVSGSRADPEAALANLLTALANYGLVTNSTTA